MEKNLIHDQKLVENIADTALQMAMDANMVGQDDLKRLALSYGYIFSTDEDEIEALFKIIAGDKYIKFAVQKNSLKMLNITDDMYDSVVEQMKGFHPCLNDDQQQSPAAKARYEKNNQAIAKMGIPVSKTLVCSLSEETAAIRDLDQICRKAIATLIAIQISCDIRNEEYQESLDYFNPIIDKFGVREYMNSKEKRIIEGTYNEQDVIDMDWAYECYWSICWCLGLVDDISDATSYCDCDEAIGFVMDCETLEDFKKNVHMRSLSEILDLFDYYYRLNWAVNETKVNPEADLGDVDASNVIERRRGLEWVLTDASDWYDLSLDA